VYSLFSWKILCQELAGWTDAHEQDCRCLHLCECRILSTLPGEIPAQCAQVTAWRAGIARACSFNCSCSTQNEVGSILKTGQSVSYWKISPPLLRNASFQNSLSFIAFEVITAMTVKATAVCLAVQLRNNPRGSASHILQLGVLFDLERGTVMVLRNFGFCPKYTMLQPRRSYSS
jgi:hypothetical protein